MRALIIEDDVHIVDFLKKSLEEKSFAVDTAFDGEKGSYMARTNEYDVILLDYSLPKKNGAQVCKEIRDAAKTTPIIAISVTQDTDLKVKMLDIGIDDYLTKPYSFNELLARIRAIMRRPSDRFDGVNLAVGNIILDVKRQMVLRGKKTIRLTRKEYALLEFLMKNKGSVVSRGMIMEHVWNIDSDPFSNTIEAHILNLRKKIEPSRGKRLIKNVPGRGYMIDE